MKLSAAAVDTACKNEVKYIDQVRLQTLYSQQDGICYLSVNPVFNQKLIYRSYLFSSEGLLMVFDSYGEGPESETTAAREFYLFPRRLKQPQYQIDVQKNTLSVQSISGLSFLFSGQKPGFLGIAPGKVSIDPEIVPSKKGGLEFLDFQGILLDVGYARGRSPSEASQNQSLFRDAQNNQCRVKNSQIFSYKNSDVYFKFSDEELLLFLKDNCPKLNLWSGGNQH
ncbi:MAG: hypothetical protein ACOYOK_05235 [Pseudobdellovibrionaceae bacterium]